MYSCVVGAGSGIGDCEFDSNFLGCLSIARTFDPPQKSVASGNVDVSGALVMCKALVEDSSASLQLAVASVLTVFAERALANETPIGEMILHFAVTLQRAGRMVAKEQLGVGWDVLGSPNDLHVANERAAAVADTRVVDLGSHKPHTGGGKCAMYGLKRLTSTAFGISHVFASRSWGAKGVHGDDLLNLEPKTDLVMFLDTDVNTLQVNDRCAITLCDIHLFGRSMVKLIEGRKELRVMIELLGNLWQQVSWASDDNLLSSRVDEDTGGAHRLVNKRVCECFLA